MVYKKQNRSIPRCLECGDKIQYGRADKKFCCDECKSRYFYNLARNSKLYKRKVINYLCKNYDILDNLIKNGSDSMDLMEMMSLGFIPTIMTSHMRSRGREECACFDIKYVMTPSRVHSIAKIENVSLTLRYIGNIKQNNDYE